MYEINSTNNSTTTTTTRKTTTVKKSINKLKPTSSIVFSISKTKTPNKTVYKKGKTTASLYFRTWAGKDYAPVKKKPILSKNVSINICDAILDKKNNIWYYI